MNRYVKTREVDITHGLTRWVPVEEISVPGPPGPSSKVIDDLDPTLSADLKLNNHGLIGQLDDGSLVIDGGLL